MSVSCWLIEGVGIDTAKIYPHIDKEKLACVLIEQLPDDEDLDEMAEQGSFAELDVHDFLYGNPFDSLADLLTHCDDTNCMTYGDDGESGDYFYYPPSMPWQLADNDPKTIEEVHVRIITAVQKITNLTSERIEELIDDDLYVVGIG